MSRLAIIKNDIIENIIIGSSRDFPDYVDVTDNNYGVGWIKDGEVFIAPIITPVTHETEISTTDFKGLFTAKEYRAINKLTETDDNAFQFWDMAQTADGIDMKDPRTMAGLNYFSGMSAITPDRLEIILLGKEI